MPLGRHRRPQAPEPPPGPIILIGGECGDVRSADDGWYGVPAVGAAGEWLASEDRELLRLGPFPTVAKAAEALREWGAAARKGNEE